MAVNQKKAKKSTTVKPTKATIEKHHGILSRLVRRFKGKLPSYTWLNENGFFRSYEIMRQNPKAFKDILSVRAFAR